MTGLKKSQKFFVNEGHILKHQQSNKDNHWNLTKNVNNQMDNDQVAQNGDHNGNVDKNQSLWDRLKQYLNFFRIHVLIFTFTPIISACIFYGANGSAKGNANSANVGVQKVTFIDSLFICFSAMTTCGLVPVNLSALHPFQQVIILFLFIIGDPQFAAFVMVLVRKRYFRTHCEQLLSNDRLRRTQTINPTKTIATENPKSLKEKIKNLKNDKKSLWISGPVEAHQIENYAQDRDQHHDDTDDQVEELEGRPGVTDSPVEMTLSEGRRSETVDSPINGKANQSQPSTLGRGSVTMIPTHPTSRAESIRGHTTALPSPIAPSFTTQQVHYDRPFMTRQRLRQQTRKQTLVPSATVNLASLDHPHPHPSPLSSQIRPQQNRSPTRKGTAIGAPLDRVRSPLSTYGVGTNKPIPYTEGHKNSGMGGFPTPLEILKDYVLPSSTKNKLSRPVKKLEILMNPTMNPGLHTKKDEEKAIDFPNSNQYKTPEHEESWTEMIRGSVANWMPEGLSGLVIGRNSRFWTEELDDDDLEQIGGVEYRALRLLSYLVGGYMIFCQVIPFAIIAIYLSKIHNWDVTFNSKAGVQTGSINKTWFALFLNASAFTGTGMSLMDQGLAPLANCYLIIYVTAFVLLAGNHAFPIILRFIIWIGTKITRKGEKFETLHFLLDHPRRCFLYLFPSHQSWYLLFVVSGFIIIELFAFLVLSIGLPIVEDLGGWQRFSDGLLQSISVRASGFGIVSISNMAPSVLFFYVILMYVAIYPIAMSVRSTNVYEERALGVYEEEDPDTLSEDEPEFKGKRHEIFSKYLLWHMRKQLAFDIWPLAVAIFLICCFERGKLMDPEKYDWFTNFRIIFECTSAYAVIGLSMGTPNNNFSFVGEFGYASKIVIILVMLRGRHRGLPVAIDRAILLPKEYSRIGKSLEGNENDNQHTDDGIINSGQPQHDEMA
ncbi:uncharacterized protein L201_003096 [Kwoniella dendrophila CBS 6074]|uniref:Potassium ion transporter n=1 Tax=Kwoniella dendrophila CBS 6074 TaxID=1295534 RepID=A0AAX4JSQ1_9TREE